MSITKHCFVCIAFLFAVALVAGCGGSKTAGGGKGASASGVKMGSFVDSRDSHKYRTVTIGGVTWMAENLNCAIGNHWCYGDNTLNCKRYGELYTWETAMTACPSGWRLPSEEEWDKLVEAVSAGDEHTAGKKLKSKEGWADSEGKNVSGTDAIGFAALPGGIVNGGGGDDEDDDEIGSGFDGLGNSGAWWTSTELEDTSDIVRVRLMNDQGRVRGGDAPKGFAMSVRCVKN